MEQESTEKEGIRMIDKYEQACKNCKFWNEEKGTCNLRAEDIIKVQPDDVCKGWEERVEDNQ